MSRRLIVLTQGKTEPRPAKTAACVIRYSRDRVVALVDDTQVGHTAGELLGVGGDIPVVARPADAPPADALLIGIAPSGGHLPPAWRPLLLEAIGCGLSIISGLHDFLGDDPELAAAATAAGVDLHDLRRCDERDVSRLREFDPRCLRIHTVGNDCSVGKMVAAIEVARSLAATGVDAKFVATGQTGMLIEGEGCPIDAVVADFVSGAAEKLVLARQHHRVLLIEGQGSLFHPSYSGVTLGLLHGCRPDGLILCYELGRRGVGGLEHVPLPPPERVRDIYETMAGLLHPAPVIGVAINSAAAGPEALAAERARVEGALGVPACDVIRDGPQRLVDAVSAMLEARGA